MRIIPLAGACLVTGLLFASPALASPIVAADAATTQVVTVSFKRAEAAAAPGARELYARLQASASIACADNRALRGVELLAYLDCKSKALDKAVADVGLASVHALHGKVLPTVEVGAPE